MKSNAFWRFTKADEKEFTVSYRNKDGEMAQCGKGRNMGSSGPQYGKTGGTYDHIDRGEMLDHIEDKVAGAHRRWGAVS